MSEARIDYESLERQRSSELEAEFQKRLKEKETTGRIDSLRKVILKKVVEGEYESAISELSRYVEMQSEYPTFFERSERYVSHCNDVIGAIDTKRNFPGLYSLPMSKQQEIFEKVMDHFEELKYYLKKIEVIEKDVKIEDLRSTVIVIKAVVYSVFLLLTIVFVKEALVGLLESFDYVINDYTNLFINWFFNLFE